MASKRLKEFLANGKLTLHLGDITAMPLEDNTVDKVFHSNCYYFWPELRKGAAEIHRVMKPGRLWHCCSTWEPYSQLWWHITNTLNWINAFLSWMYPGGLMVTTLRLDRLVASQKIFLSDNWQPEIYMAALRDCGFTDVQMEDRMDKCISYQAIYAKALKHD